MGADRLFSSIVIDITRQSSESIQCENIFGNDLTAFKTENAILLQTGEIDSTDEQPPVPVAIVVINKTEIILKLIEHTEAAASTTRQYAGEGYRIKLHYVRQISGQNETIFKGNFFIEYKGHKSSYEIEGTSCNL